MNEEAPKKRRRRRKRRRSGAGNGAAAPMPAAAAVAAPAPEADDLSERAAIRAERQAMALAEAAGDDLAARVLAMILQARDRQVWEWMQHNSGGGPYALLRHIVRGAVVRSRTDYREAMGGGGASSRSIEKLSERLG